MNPVLPGWYADPELHFFQGRFTLYPTCSRRYDEQTYFEAWSSDDLAHWRCEGRILDFADIPWSTNRAAWAPTVAEWRGRYWMVFSAGDGAGLGLAVSDSPTGPFLDTDIPFVADYHFGAQPIDAHLFIDDPGLHGHEASPQGDGVPILYWGGHRRAVCARVDLERGEVGEIREITPEGYVEAPFMLRRGETYYFMWSEGSWGDETYGVAYARSSSPFGPFVREGCVLRSDPAVATSAGHHSILRLPGTDEYVIAYHRRPLGETDRDHRVVCLDRVFFAQDGGIEPVRMTHEGVGRFA